MAMRLLRSSRSVGLGLFRKNSNFPSHVPISLRSLTTRAEQTEASGSTPTGSVAASAEHPTGPKEKHTFQAETKQLLNIVANSLYTDKHVFIRELVSNASDALEKLRHGQVAGEATDDAETPLQVRITTDEATNTITIADTGIGMSKAELIENLGTIARSGSKAFVEKLKAQGKAAADGGAGIIGQFGVGFYSAFMVCDRLEVFSRSSIPGSPAYCWTSDGDGSYEISEAAGVTRGTKVVIRLRESCREFSNPIAVKDILMRYSQFVQFPITLNGKQVNTVQAIWAMSKASITAEQYEAFYKFKSGDFESPLYRLHFSSDAPIALNALLFVGQSHEEKYGMGRIKPGVDLYSRKVLIEASSKVLPDWLRFMHGVVDSEDIPLNISRETMQDSALVKRLSSVLTRRVLRFFDSEARREPQRYNQKFFMEFGQFLKEGAVTDTTYAPDIAKLLRFESSTLPAGSLTSFDDYISRMPPGQKDIYYLVAPHRGIAEASPYMEAFKGARKRVAAAAGKVSADADVVVASDAAAAAAVPPVDDSSVAELHVDDVEVLFLYSSIDDFVMNSTREFSGRRLVTAETAELNPETLKGLQPGGANAAAGDSAADQETTRLTDAQVDELGSWLLQVLPTRLSKVRATNRLSSSPAVVTDHESAAMRRMMRLVEQSAGKDAAALKAESHMLPKQTLEVNPSHPIIVRLHKARLTQPDMARVVAEQVVDNALIAAGLVDDSRTMLPRLTALLELVLGGSATSYKSEAALESRRFIPEREVDERAGLDLASKLSDDLNTEIKRNDTSDAKHGY